MKLVVIGGNGFIGPKLVARLRDRNQEALGASPHSGVNTLTGEGLAEALTGAQAVVDVTNSSSFDDAAAIKLLETSSRTLLAAETAVGILRSTQFFEFRRRIADSFGGEKAI